MSYLRGRVEEFLIKKRTMPQTELYFEVHITEHCNLNCAYCSHFSPLASESYLDLNSFENDCKRISYLTNKHLIYIYLMGGEPLLHPNLTELLKTARNYFDKKTVIAIITNGILLPKQSGCFWQSCAEHDIQIYISKYPIEIDINTIHKYSTQYHIKCEYYAHSILSHSQFNVNTLPEEGEKAFKMMKMPFDLNGQQNIIDNFKYCGFANSCLTLRDGRLYTCAPAAHAWLFNGYFGQKLNISREDSIDIYNAKSKNEILEFLASPIPFCRYCNVKGRSGDHKWGISKKILTEWV